MEYCCFIPGRGCVKQSLSVAFGVFSDGRSNRYGKDIVNPAVLLLNPKEMSLKFN